MVSALAEFAEMYSVTPYPVKQHNKMRKFTFSSLEWRSHPDQCLLQLKWTTALNVSLIIWRVLSFSRPLPLRSYKPSLHVVVFLHFWYLLDLTFHFNALSIIATNLGTKAKGALENDLFPLTGLMLFLLWITGKYSNNKHRRMKNMQYII